MRITVVFRLLAPLIVMAPPLLAQEIGGLAAKADNKRVALVIGNSAYQNTPKLENPKNDATDIASVLKKLGFRVIEGFDLEKAAMDRKIQQFAEALSGGSVGLFYYAGHGLQVEGQNYLVPIDAKLKTKSALNFDVVRVDLVQRAMEAETQTNIIVLDACRDNPLARNLARALGTRSASIGRGLAPVESGEGTLISFSTQPGNVALDGEGRNSPFAGAILKHISAPGDDLSSILINVRNDVMRATERRQVPWEHSALMAKFYFTPPTPVVPVEVQVETNFWNIVKGSDHPEVLQTYLDRYPQGRFADVAAARIEQRRQLRAEQAREEIEVRRFEEARRSAEEAKWAEQLKQATDQARAAREVASAAEERSKAALRDSTEARAAADAARKAQAAAAAAEEQRLQALKAAETAKLALDAAKMASQSSIGEQTRTERLQLAAAPAVGDVQSSPASRFASLGREQLARELQRELSRVGCDPGPISGQWGGKATEALTRFVQYTNVATVADQPTAEALDIVSAQRVRICPLECPRGEVSVGERCVPKPKVTSARKSPGAKRDTPKDAGCTGLGSGNSNLRGLFCP